jgi:hypothetical protein
MAIFIVNMTKLELNMTHGASTAARGTTTWSHLGTPKAQIVHDRLITMISIDETVGSFGCRKWMDKIW